MMEQLAEFVDANAGQVPAPGAVLSRVMNRVRAGEATQQEGELQMPKPPKPLLPSKRNPVSFLEIPPLEVARQLTLIDWGLFKRLEASELIEQAWKRDTRAKDAPNVIGLIARSDYVSGLVATEILRQEKPKERAMVISRLLQVADECRGLQNWNGTMAVLSGLRTQPIYRLQETWALLSPKAWELWDTLKEIIKPEDNYTKLRQLMSVPASPAIPFLGVYLGDLIKLDENETYLPGTRLVNLTKLRAIAEIVFRIQAMQRSPYSLEIVPGVQEFLTTAPVFGENELFKQSLQREEKKPQTARKRSASGKLVVLVLLGVLPPLRTPGLSVRYILHIVLLATRRVLFFSVGSCLPLLGHLLRYRDRQGHRLGRSGRARRRGDWQRTATAKVLVRSRRSRRRLCSMEWVEVGHRLGSRGRSSEGIEVWLLCGGVIRCRRSDSNNRCRCACDLGAGLR